MTGPLVLQALGGALSLIEGLGPIVQQMVKDGLISSEEQKALDDRVAALRPDGTAFAGPEWEVRPS